MAVYVDTARNQFGRMIMCHMIADTAAELHEMAERIGVQRKWFQTPDGPKRASFPHYDVSISRRDRAIAAGAIVLGRHRFVDVMRSVRARIIDDVEFAATWRFAWAG